MLKVDNLHARIGERSSRDIARTVHKVLAADANDESDLEHWRSLDMAERIDAALDIRNQHHGFNDEIEQRFERVLARVECR